ncbi:MAG: ADP-ribosylglycohydrolase family protein [Desulfuromonas sp.]|nr:ADP-ribosylglycohydrolase family protein [Desulfuromonas sp.]
MERMPADDPLLQLYFEGDRLGASAEGMSGATLSFEQIMARRNEHPNGTDESDSVRLFIRYADSDCWDGDYGRFAAGWAAHLTRYHAVTSYGRTWRDLFALVRHVEKTTGRPISYAKLTEMARDRNSCGNGCLALAYPAWRYARTVGGDPYRLARVVTEVSHAHPIAQRCVAALVGCFETGDPSTITSDCFPPAGAEACFTHLAPGCLWAALECAGEATRDDAIRRAASIGGDVDSYLSLGLLLWGHRNRDLLVNR